MKSQTAKMPHMTCPSCGGRAFARTIGKHTPLYREVYYHCRNPDACGHQFVVSMEPTRSIQASRYPNPIAILPVTGWRGHPANDDAANDDASELDPCDGPETETDTRKDTRP